MLIFRCCLLLLLTILTACSRPETLVQEQLYFDEQVVGHRAVEVLKIRRQGFALQYARSGNVKAPAIVYIHGTPGGWDNGARYLMDKELQKVAHMVSVDRPGWGGSRPVDGQSSFDFAEQARILKPLLEALKEQNEGKGIILLGHSLGASLSPFIAMQYPELVDGMVLLAGSLDPKLGKPRWYNLAASMGVVSWFLNAEMRKANREIMPLHAQLESMHGGWKALDIPVTVIQGGKDKLVFPENADFAEQALINADLKIMRLPHAGHFLPWEERPIIKRELLLMLGKLN